jgi:gliding motility-associated transport system permease protein
MKGLAAIYRRELAGLFLTPLAWVLLCIALLVNGWFFLAYVQEFQGDVDTALRFACGGSWVFWSQLVFLPPLLTMRMISEEARTGILEFLLTAPVSDAAVVVGKFLAATTVMAVLWLCLPAYALLVQALGTAPDWPAVLGGFLGTVLASALFCGIGVLWSAITGTPLLAAFLAFVSNLLFLLLPFFRPLTHAAWLHAVMERVDVIGAFNRSFQLGVLDTARVVFFAAWAAFFVFLAVRVVETRRWR